MKYPLRMRLGCDVGYQCRCHLLTCNYLPAPKNGCRVLCRSSILLEWADVSLQKGGFLVYVEVVVRFLVITGTGTRTSQSNRFDLRQFRQVGAKFLEIHGYSVSLRGCFCFGKFYRFFLLIISPEMISIQAQINNTAASHRGSR